MKIETTLTIRLTPESRDETIHHFAGRYRELREQVEAHITNNATLPALPVDISRVRWLLISGRWE